MICDHDAPREDSLYLHLKKKGSRQKGGKVIESHKKIIYRRIGPDLLPDGTPHPAPWARLDRQFIIKLQGEEEGVREASNEELWAVHQFEARVGRNSPIIDLLVENGWGETEKQKKRLEMLSRFGWQPEKRDQRSTLQNEDGGAKPSLAVDDLMSVTVRTMRLGLKRHGDRARVAFAMVADYKSMPGGRRYYFHEARDLSVNDDQEKRESEHKKFIADALILWSGLICSPGWKDSFAKGLWHDYVVTLKGFIAPLEYSKDMSPRERAAIQRDNGNKLAAVATALVRDETLRKNLHDAWSARWETDDCEWRKQLCRFKDWVLPSGRRCGDRAIRKVGGLSLTRLATLTEFRRKVQVGFFTRLKPDGTRAVTKEQFGQRTMDSLNQLREQRVKQISSRIVEAALGAGRIRFCKNGKPPLRPDTRVDEPCHAVIIENLSNYRPADTRTRRENRQLMIWSSSKVKKYLTEACQLHGLHLREVSASYTSQQDSRTGAPGIRCQDVSVREFMNSPFWRKQREYARKRIAEGKADLREKYICDMAEIFEKEVNDTMEKAGHLRIPLRGGEIFVSADLASPAASGLQADLNAAANIGLRALLDPDWPGKWWYVFCESATYCPIKEKIEGSAVANLKTTLRPAAHMKEGNINAGITLREKSGSSKKKDVVNLWRDVSATPLDSIQAGDWKDYATYTSASTKKFFQFVKRWSKH